MPILDAALAFALTMLVVATAATQILRVIQYYAEKRGSELREMLKKYFEQELESAVKKGLSRCGKTGIDLSDAIQGVKTAWHKADGDSLLGCDAEQKKKCVSVSTERITDWLQQSELGKTLVSQLGDESQKVFEEIAKRYEEIGRAFTESFRSHSRRWTTGIAFGVALIFNIDSITLLDSYLRRQETSRAVIAQAAAFAEGAKRLGDSSALPDGPGTATKTQADILAAARNQLDLLSSSGLPAGWDLFPYVCLDKRDSPACTGAIPRSIPARIPRWLVGILLTGLLAGLGSPFWYDAMTGLSRLAQQARTDDKKAKA